MMGGPLDYKQKHQRLRARQARSIICLQTTENPNRKPKIPLFPKIRTCKFKRSIH